MKKHLFLYTILCITLLFGCVSHVAAQQVSTDTLPSANTLRINNAEAEADKAIKEQTKELTTRGLHAFYDLWQEESSRYGQVQEDTLCDQIIQMVFDRFPFEKDENFEEIEEKPYIVLPSAIEVNVYRKDFPSEERQVEIFKWMSNYEIENAFGLDSTYLYVPHLKTSSKILYGFAAANTKLAKYLDKAPTSRIPDINSRMYVHQGHWGGWNICSIPCVYFINVFPNGYYVGVRSSWCTGGCYFINKATGEVKKVSGWME